MIIVKNISNKISNWVVVVAVGAVVGAKMVAPVTPRGDIGDGADQSNEVESTYPVRGMFDESGESRVNREGPVYGSGGERDCTYSLRSSYPKRFIGISVNTRTFNLQFYFTGKLRKQHASAVKKGGWERCLVGSCAENSQQSDNQVSYIKNGSG